MNKILWVDLETTGLDENESVILEVAAMVTTGDLKEISRYQAVVHQLEPSMRAMNQYVRDMHTSSGLLNEVRASLKSEGEVEKEFRAYILDEFGGDKPVVAGSSVHFDKRFLKKHMPTVEALCHYRIIDVSSFKETFRLVHGFELPKNFISAHRGLDDIQASINEFRQYLNFIQVPRG